MAQKQASLRNILTRGLALMVMLSIYGFNFIGGSALLLGASSTGAQARGHGGGFRGGGFRGGGFRGAGLGLGLGLAPYGYYGGYYPYEGDAGVCYAVRRRVLTRYGWRMSRVSVCE
jgi:hypothetical protein